MTPFDKKTKFLLDMLIKAEENSKQIESIETVINLMIKKINFTNDLLDEMEL